MPALIIRNLSEATHDALKRIAKERRVPVEALARQALDGLAREASPSGIDFARLDEDRRAAGFHEDGPAWTDAMDSPQLSRDVLKRKPRRR